METSFLKRLGRIVASLALAVSLHAVAADDAIVVASTTSTEQSGLFGHILPIFEKETGIGVKVVALGTGQALDIGRRGDADVLLVHDRAAEDKFVAEGYGSYRRDVMYNDFVIVGPGGDPAALKEAKDTAEAFKRIAASGVVFVSRGDNSGTHAAERRVWKAAGIEPSGQGWYKEAGSGMGPTLNMAAGIDAYTLSDRGTWANFKNRGTLRIVYAGDPGLFNPYGVILVSPAKHPHVKKVQAERFIDWITSDKGRQAIASYKIDGEQLFFPSSR